MSVSFPLRDNFDAAALRLAAKATKHAAQARRLLAVATIDDGGSRSDAARRRRDADGARLGAGAQRRWPGQAGRRRLAVPANITLLPLSPLSPELNPVENVWQSLCDRWLSNRVFASHADILDHCREAWRKLIDQAWRIISLGLWKWAHR